MPTNDIDKTPTQELKDPIKAYRGPLRQIRELCRECAGGPKSARYCSGVNCPLWPYRFGKHPKRVIREGGEGSACFFDKDWVLQEAKRGL
jgi:hypothetical protein